MDKEWILYKRKNTVVSFGIHIGLLFGITGSIKHDIDVYISFLCFAIHIELVGKGTK
jgi:hypothetical protein